MLKLIYQSHTTCFKRNLKKGNQAVQSSPLLGRNPPHAHCRNVSVFPNAYRARLVPVLSRNTPPSEILERNLGNKAAFPGVPDAGHA